MKQFIIYYIKIINWTNPCDDNPLNPQNYKLSIQKHHPIQHFKLLKDKQSKKKKEEGEEHNQTRAYEHTANWNCILLSQMHLQTRISFFESTLAHINYFLAHNSLQPISKKTLSLLKFSAFLWNPPLERMVKMRKIQICPCVNIMGMTCAKYMGRKHNYLTNFNSRERSDNV